MGRRSVGGWRSAQDDCNEEGSNPEREQEAARRGDEVEASPTRGAAE